MLSVLVATVLAIIPIGDSYDRVPLVEINHCYNRETGDLRFVQIVYWSRQRGSTCLHVRHWHMRDLVVAIYKDSSGRYVVVRKINDGQSIRTTIATRIRETHTTYDPEEEDRQVFPLEARLIMEK